MAQDSTTEGDATAAAGETGGDSAAAQSGWSLHEPDGLAHPRLALGTGAMFVVAMLPKMHLFNLVPATLGRIDSLASAALMILTACWFIQCFTGNARRRINDIFVFAYAFTLGSFAMLVLPFVYEQPIDGASSQRSATLELVRGCVRSNAMGGLSDVSAVVTCPADPEKTRTWPDYREKDGKLVAYTGELRYTLLLAIGGVTATVRTDPDAAAPAGAASGAAGQQQHVEVIGGLAVPFFVLVMAFIGGAVSLSRRIPEFQRRLHPSFQPSAAEPGLRAFEAREEVVFQIMQLVSAPFLAVATWYIVTPSGLTSAATLAFGTGFASEPLLLMIRGLVEGIRPDSTRPQPPVQPQLPAPVKDPGGVEGGGQGGAQAEAAARKVETP